MSTKHQLPMGPRHWSSKKGILGVSSTSGGRRVRAVRRVAVRKAVDESSLTRMLGWFVSEIIPVTGFFSVVNFRIACRILDATHLFSTENMHQALRELVIEELAKQRTNRHHPFA